MRKNLCRLLLPIAIHFSMPASTQMPYYDAQELKTAIINGQIFVSDSDPNLAILAQYLPKPTLNAVDVKQAFADNPFFKIAGSPRAETFPAKTISKAVSGIGGLNVTAIADGLARFLIKRGREELNIAFFQRMKAFLEENTEAKTLFPATSMFLGNIASYRYAELLQSLREAFYKDLRNLIVNLNILIDLPKYKELLKALPEIRVAIRSAKIVGELSQANSSIHPADLIHRLAFLNEWHEMDLNLENSWKLLDYLSESVRKRNYEIKVSRFTKEEITLQKYELKKDSSMVDTVAFAKNLFKPRTTVIPKGTIIIDTIKTLINVERSDTLVDREAETAWIKYVDFHDNILRRSTTLKVFLGLLYERVENLSFRIKGDTVSAQQFFKEHADDMMKISDLVENFILLGNEVDLAVKDFRTKSGSLTNDDYYGYIEKSINIIEYGFKVANIIKPEVTADRYIVMARNANSLYKNIYTKSYNAAIMNGYLILDQVLSKSLDAVKDKDSFLLMSNSVIPAVKDSFLLAKARLVKEGFFKEDADRARSLERILRYGNVMAGIVKSETPEEAESAIEAAALPAGSSSIKKNSAWNFSLNAYIGGYYSNYTNDADKIDGSNSKIRVAAPVGFAFSKGLGHFNNGSTIGSLSIFLNFIDVGAIAGYRLSGDSTALEQKLTLSDIFAPGGYLVYGIGLPFLEYVPLSIGYGWQYGSKLYFKRSNGVLAVSDNTRWRSNWYVAIDIPLANFWTKNSRNKR